MSCRDQVISLRGAAGVGKTTVLREIDREIQKEGKTCWHCAPTSSAADTLRQEGMTRATTVADFLLNVSRRESLRGSVIVVDEAGLSSNKQGGELLRLASVHEARIIFVGDTRQHTAVEAGDFLRVLESHSNLARTEISTIRRQTDPDYRKAVQLMAHDRVREGLEKFDRMGWVKEGRAGYLEAAADDYLRLAGKTESLIAVTPSWEENLYAHDIDSQWTEETGQASRWTVIRNTGTAPVDPSAKGGSQNLRTGTGPRPQSQAWRSPTRLRRRGPWLKRGSSHRAFPIRRRCVLDASEPGGLRSHSYTTV